MATTQDVDRLTFSVKEVSDALGVSDQTIRRWIANGEIQAIRVGTKILCLAQPLVDRILASLGDSETIKKQQALYASSVLMTDVASASLTPGSFAYSAPWAVAYSLSFTLQAKQTILCVYQQSFYANGGTASYCFVAQNVDVNNVQAGGTGLSICGSGISSSTIFLRVASLPAGNHTWYGLYHMDAGATTTYNTVSLTSGLYPQVDIYIIGA